MTATPQSPPMPATTPEPDNRKQALAILIVVLVIAGALATLLLVRPSNHAGPTTVIGNSPVITSSAPHASGAVPSQGIGGLDIRSLASTYGNGSAITEPDQTTVFYSAVGSPDHANALTCRVGNQNNPAAALVKAKSFFGQCASVTYVGGHVAQNRGATLTALAALHQGESKTYTLDGAVFTLNLDTTNTYNLTISL